MQVQTYKVYRRTVNGKVEYNSDAFLTDLTGWELIDEGTGDEYLHAQHYYAPVTLTPSELRESAYNTLPCITWDDKQITVTQAAILWAYYSAEGSAKAEQLQSLISTAKAQIRTQYPEEAL